MNSCSLHHTKTGWSLLGTVLVLGGLDSNTEGRVSVWTTLYPESIKNLLLVGLRNYSATVTSNVAVILVGEESSPKKDRF